MKEVTRDGLRRIGCRHRSATAVRQGRELQSHDGARRMMAGQWTLNP